MAVRQNETADRLVGDLADLGQDGAEEIGDERAEIEVDVGERHLGSRCR